LIEEIAAAPSTLSMASLIFVRTEAALSPFAKVGIGHSMLKR
jgi:hypothetical protein